MFKKVVIFSIFIWKIITAANLEPIDLSEIAPFSELDDMFFFPENLASADDMVVTPEPTSCRLPKEVGENTGRIYNKKGMRLRPGAHVMIGGRVTLKCGEGFEIINGPETAHCLKNGELHPELGRCAAVAGNETSTTPIEASSTTPKIAKYVEGHLAMSNDVFAPETLDSSLAHLDPVAKQARRIVHIERPGDAGEESSATTTQVRSLVELAALMNTQAPANAGPNPWADVPSFDFDIKSLLIAIIVSVGVVIVIVSGILSLVCPRTGW